MSKLTSFFVLLLVLWGRPSVGAPQVYDVDWKLDGAITVGATIVGAVPYLMADDLIRRRCPCPASEVNGFDRGAIGKDSRLAAWLSDGTVAASVALAVVLDGFQTDWSGPFYDDMLVLAQTLAINGALNSAVKHLVQRPLPASYAGDPRIMNRAEGYRSFYSGHTSTASAALAFSAYTTTRRLGPSVWPWLIAGAGGLATGLLRVEAGRHFYTDILVGAAMGTAVGIVTPWLHTIRPGGAAWLPAPLPGGVALSAAWRW